MKALLLTCGLGALLQVGCGGFDNSPIRVGAVRGRLMDGDGEVALVSLLGHPELRTRVSPEGGFELHGLPATSAALFVIASRTSAAKVPVELRGAQMIDVGEVRGLPGAFVRVRVVPPSHQRVTGSHVEVLGTPHTGYLTGADGIARIGPLPEGCYLHRATLAGLGAAEEEVCVAAGAQTSVDLELPQPTGNGDGCVVTGCQPPYICHRDGSCQE